jgi:hypothetical protein
VAIAAERWLLSATETKDGSDKSTKSTLLQSTTGETVYNMYLPCCSNTTQSTAIGVQSMQEPSASGCYCTTTTATSTTTAILDIYS